MRRVVAVALALGACTAREGTITVSLVTAPGSTLLDNVTRLRLITTSPREVVEAERGSDLAIDLTAAGGSNALIVEGRDVNNELIAYGQSPPFTLLAIDARISVYMATPMSIDRSPADLDPVRSHLSAAALPYGAVLAGGLEGALPSDAIAIYNAYDHSLTRGLAMPAPRVGVTIAVDQTGHALLFGGAGADLIPTGTLWSFDTTAAPAGSYTDFGEQGSARTDQIAVNAHDGTFLISGSPAIELVSGASASILVRGDLGTLPSTGTSLTTSDGVVTSIFTGVGTPMDSTFVRIRVNNLDTPFGGDSMRQNAVLAPMAGDQVVLVGGNDPSLGATFARELITLEAIPGGSSGTTGTLNFGRANAGAATTSRYLVVVGGVAESGEVLDSAEVFDAHTLEMVRTLQLLVARRSPTVLALPNDQVLIVGGLDANNLPIAVIELFTPDPAADPP